MIVLKNEIARIKEKSVNRNIEQLRESLDTNGIDINIANVNDMMLWMNSARDFIKSTKKGLKNDIKNLLNSIRRS